MSEVTYKGQALNNVVIVKEVQRENKTGGIDYSSEADRNEKFRHGIVQSIGENVPVNPKTGKPTINPGDLVTYDKHRMTEYSEDGVTYKLGYYGDLFLKPKNT